MQGVFAALACSLFGFLCLPGAEPGRAEFERARAEVREAAPIAGRASVIDGDTIEIGGVRVRLQGIDAPEAGQACEDEAGKAWRCGAWAAAELERLIGGRTVTCRRDPRDPEDRYGRALGLCAAGGEDLSIAMALAGAAVAYRKYLTYRGGAARPYAVAILAAEEEAQRAKRGIHRGAFVEPDSWRWGKRQGL